MGADTKVSELIEIKYCKLFRSQFSYKFCLKSHTAVFKARSGSALRKQPYPQKLNADPQSWTSREPREKITLAGVLDDEVVKGAEPGGYLVAGVGLAGVLGGRGGGLAPSSLLLTLVLEQLRHCVLKTKNNKKSKICLCFSKRTCYVT